MFVDHSPYGARGAAILDVDVEASLRESRECIRQCGYALAFRAIGIGLPPIPRPEVARIEAAQLGQVETMYGSPAIRRFG